MTTYYPARDGHPSMFVLDNAAAVETAPIPVDTSRRPYQPEIPENSPAKTDSLQIGGASEQNQSPRNERMA